MKHYLKKKKKNANKFRSNTLITTINFHCDFEQGIITKYYNKYNNTQKLKLLFFFFLLFFYFKYFIIYIYYNTKNRNG